MKKVLTMFAFAVAFVGTTMTAKADVKTVSFDASVSSDDVVLSKKDNAAIYTSEDGVKFTVANKAGNPVCVSCVAPANMKVAQSSISVKADSNNPNIVTVSYDVVEHYVYADSDKEIYFGGEWTTEEIKAALSRPIDGIKPKDFAKVNFTMLSEGVNVKRSELALANPNTVIVSSSADLASNGVESLFLDEAAFVAKK